MARRLSPLPSDPKHRRRHKPQIPDIRPLDRIPSLKIKLGALVGASVTVAVLITWIGLRNQIGPRWTLPLGIFVGMALTLVLSRGMTKPLRQMRDATRAMAGGDYSQRVRASSHDEVGQLAMAFNTMAAELDAADQTRRDLIANVAHELRTPIAALHAQLENLVDGVIDPSPSTLNTALKQTDRLTRLVGYLLDLSRLEAGSADLVIERLDLEPFLRECTDALVMAGGAHHVSFQVDVEPPGLTVPADQARLEQVIINLLENAVRHSPPQGIVRLHAWSHGADVVIDVADDGPGIEGADRERIFARFVSGSTQPPKAGASTSGGTGIGLSIVRWAVTLHGGSVTVADSDQGALIRVVLPALR